jgi:cytochrome c oxidase assembly protein subunit 15
MAMTAAPPINPWLRRFAWTLAALTLLLICSGGMVTSKGVGLAVPDWPTTFGYNMFLFPVSQWVGGIFFEHTHRLIASTVGFLTIVLGVWLWRTEMRWLGLAALGAVVLQGVLGGLRVTMLKDEIGIFHACLAQAFFGLLVYIAWSLSSASDRRRTKRARFYWLALAATALIYLQLGLGATMRHQHRDLSILDFPTAYGRIIPDVSAASLVAVNQWRDARALSNVTAAQIWLQMAHRFVALLIAAAVVGFWFVVRSRISEAGSTIRALSTWWLLFLLCQITLGAWTIWSNKAADIATAHVAVGATMLAFGVVVSARSMRGERVVAPVRRVAQQPAMQEGVHSL